jgi:hypothetical protein
MAVDLCDDDVLMKNNQVYLQVQDCFHVEQLHRSVCSGSKCLLVLQSLGTMVLVLLTCRHASVCCFCSLLPRIKFLPSGAERLASFVSALSPLSSHVAAGLV